MIADLKIHVRFRLRLGALLRAALAEARRCGRGSRLLARAEGGVYIRAAVPRDLELGIYRRVFLFV
jgi:hypothetical protein